jgi:hypothetical protein
MDGTTTVDDALSRRLAPTAMFEEHFRTTGLSPERLKLLGGGQRREAQGSQQSKQDQESLPADPFGQGSSQFHVELPAIPRSGETTVADILRSFRYDVEDCSRQTVGYDLRPGQTPLRPGLLPASQSH